GRSGRRRRALARHAIAGDRPGFDGAPADLVAESGVDVAGLSVAVVAAVDGRMDGADGGAAVACGADVVGPAAVGGLGSADDGPGSQSDRDDHDDAGCSAAGVAAAWIGMGGAAAPR